MTELNRYLPSPASDTAGACSALFNTGGLTVIHDAAGCLESYSAYDEPRVFGSDSMLFSSHLTNRQAVTGDERELISQTSETAVSLKAKHIALVGSPVPYTIGTDLEGIAAEIEAETGIRSFAVICGGFKPYLFGASNAMYSLAEKTILGEKPNGLSVNLLGVTPLDFSEGETAEMRRMLLSAGAENVFVTFAHDELRFADVNVAVSSSGIKTARYMLDKYGIPFTIGIPFTVETAKKLIGGETCLSEKSDAKADVLVIGEPIFALSLASLLKSEKGITAKAICGFDYPEKSAITAVKRFNTEGGLAAEINRGYRVIIGDKLYKALLANAETRFIERAHAALSSHLFKKPNGFEYINQIKEIIK